MSDVRVILLCSNRFAIPALQELAFFKQLAVVAVPRDSGEMLENVQAVLTGIPIPILVLEKKNFHNQLADAIKKYEVTIGLVMTFTYKIPASVYKLPIHGFFNVHPGPLPGYGGPDPIFQQLKNRELNAGVTIHELDDELDTGPVVITEMIRIEPRDTYGLMTTKLSVVAVKLVRVLLKLAGFGRGIPSRPQDTSKQNYFKKQNAADVTIDWETMDALTIIALINACNPWNKGAITKINNKIIRLLDAEEIMENPTPDNPAGVITAIGKEGMSVSTIGQKALRVQVVYIDEGFLKADRLEQLGILRGQRFEKISQENSPSMTQKNL